MLHLEAEWPSKQNILIAETILAEPGPYPGFKVWGNKIHIKGKDFYFYHMFKINFSEHNKISGVQKIFGDNCPECPPCLQALAEPSPESLPLGSFMFVQGD